MRLIVVERPGTRTQANMLNVQYLDPIQVKTVYMFRLARPTPCHSTTQRHPGTEAKCLQNNTISSKSCPQTSSSSLHHPIPTS